MAPRVLTAATPPPAGCPQLGALQQAAASVAAEANGQEMKDLGRGAPAAGVKADQAPGADLVRPPLVSNLSFNRIE